MSKLIVAMSGGVDSSVALRLLLDEGHELLGVTFVTDSSEESKKAARDAAEVAAKMNVPHEVMDISEEFRSAVKEYFVRTYEEGGTPNPCVVCNREIKLGVLLRYAEEKGFDGVATGHYAAVDKTGERARLLKAADVTKDQTYVLAHVTEPQLKKAYFPLGAYTKETIRAMAEKMGLSVADKKDSQDICFIPDGDYVRFLTDYRGRAPRPGKYVSPDGTVLGEHRGQECYTIGQRKGLGIALGRHMFVLEKNAETGNVTLGDSEALMKKSITVAELNLIGRSELCDGERFDVKIRYAHRASPAAVFHREQGKLEIIFDEAQRAPSKGQLAVLYSDNEAVASGIIL